MKNKLGIYNATIVLLILILTIDLKWMHPISQSFCKQKHFDQTSDMTQT